MYYDWLRTRCEDVFFSLPNSACVFVVLPFVFPPNSAIPGIVHCISLVRVSRLSVLLPCLDVRKMVDFEPAGCHLQFGMK